MTRKIGRNNKYIYKLLQLDNNIGRLVVYIDHLTDLLLDFIKQVSFRNPNKYISINT